MVPTIISGGVHLDARGTLLYNNSFDATQIKRVYIIENKNTSFIRGWQGHRIEQRWFSAIHGSFRIRLMAVDSWDNPSRDLDSITFIIEAKKMDVLHTPSGYLSSIQSLTDHAKLLVMADYKLGEINDEYRFDINHFIK